MNNCQLKTVTDKITYLRMLGLGLKLGSSRWGDKKTEKRKLETDEQYEEGMEGAARSSNRQEGLE